MGVISLICIINGIGGLIGIALYIFWGLVLHPAHGLIRWIRKCHKENKRRREQEIEREKLKPAREEYAKACEEIYAADLARRTEGNLNLYRAYHSSYTDEEMRQRAEQEAKIEQVMDLSKVWVRKKEDELWREICLKNGLEDYSELLSFARMP